MHKYLVIMQLYNTVLKTFHLFISLKKYGTKRTNKLLPYFELCEWAFSYIMLAQV